MTASYEVFAVRYATRRAAKSELYFRYGSYGEPDVETNLDYYFWVLRDGQRTLMVDTGFSVAAAERRGFSPAGGDRSKRSYVCSPIEAFARLGIDGPSVAEVIVTHFHWDHIGNLDAFPGATLHVPERELEFWTGPLAHRRQFWEHAEGEDISHVEAANRAGRVRTYTDGVQLAPGVAAISLPGHSPGQHGLILETASGQVILASDATHFYQELELDRPFGVCVDIEEMYETYETLRKLAKGGAVVVPGHDPEVAKRFPSVEGDAAVIAVRIA